MLFGKKGKYLDGNGLKEAVTHIKAYIDDMVVAVKNGGTGQSHYTNMWKAFGIPCSTRNGDSGGNLALQKLSGFHVAGTLTGSKKELFFTIPFSMFGNENRKDGAYWYDAISKVIGATAEIITRQDGAYTHGSSATNAMFWALKSCDITQGGLRLCLYPTDGFTDNAVNNSAIGVECIQLDIIVSTTTVTSDTPFA